MTFVAVRIGIAGRTETPDPIPATADAPTAVRPAAEDHAEAQKAAAAEAAEQASRDAAEAERQAEAEAARIAAEEAAASEEAELLDPSNYAALTDREWAQVERDPDSHVGERYVIYGHVFQFDANTGPASFVALTSGEPKSGWWDYEIDTLVDGRSAETVETVVEGDLVTMYVEVLGSTSYTTLMGGYNTTPHVRVNVLSVDGRAEG